MQSYGHKWISGYGETPNSEWERSIRLLGAVAVKRGFTRLITEKRFTDWPPTLPQFERLCELHPEDVGCPPLDAAWRNAQVSAYPYARARWLHKAVWWAACKTGMTDIAEGKKRCEKDFAHWYEKALLQLDEIPDPPTAMLEQKHVVTEEDRKAGETALDEIKKLLRRA